MTAYEITLLKAIRDVLIAMYDYKDSVSNYIDKIYKYENQSLAEEVLNEKRRFTEEQLKTSLDYLKEYIKECKDSLLDKLDNLAKVVEGTPGKVSITYDVQNQFNYDLKRIMRNYDFVLNEVNDVKEIGYELNDVDLGLNDLNNARRDLDYKISEFNRKSNLKLMDSYQAIRKSRERTVGDTADLLNREVKNERT